MSDQEVAMTILADMGAVAHVLFIPVGGIVLTLIAFSLIAYAVEEAQEWSFRRSRDQEVEESIERFGE